jgi:hypothetical protein
MGPSTNTAIELNKLDALVCCVGSHFFRNSIASRDFDWSQTLGLLYPQKMKAEFVTSALLFSSVSSLVSGSSVGYDVVNDYTTTLLKSGLSVKLNMYISSKKHIVHHNSHELCVHKIC